MDAPQIPLKDLHLPDAIGWWPLAPGWWLVIALLVIGLGLLLRSGLRRRSRAAARRHALGQLKHCRSAYADHGNSVQLGIEVSEILRRTMLAYAPRGDVAGLTGDEWLEWLDRDLAAPRFSQGAGRGLLELPYLDPATVAEVDIDKLLAVVQERLKTPVGGRA